ncbi:MAG: binding-protein-dependent transport system inner rane component [Solirubrobacterales bacterium]|nr:binding-protein-dependent transport system inner rane component [Solirubrobacterales bacterium]
MSTIPVPAPPRPKTLLSRRVRFGLLRVGSLVAFLGLWQWYATQPDQYAVASPTEVGPDLWNGITDGTLPNAMLGTMSFMVVGLLIAAVLGIGLGLLVAASDVADNTLTPLINSAYAAPITLLIPIIGVYTGIDFWGKVFLVVAFSVFVILVNTESGIRSVPAEMIETAAAFCLTRRQLVRHVVVPAAMPYLLTGLRLGVGRAFRGAIVADLLLAVDNLGEVLVTAGSTFNVTRLLTGVLFTTLVGYLLMSIVEAAEQRILPWRTRADFGS